MKPNGYELKILADNPLRRVLQLKDSNAIIYNCLSQNDFSDELLDKLLVCGTKNIEVILYNHLQSTPNLLTLKFKPEDIATIIYKNRAKDVLEALTKNFSRLNRDYTIDQIVEIAQLSGALPIIRTLCSSHVTRLKENKIDKDQIYELAKRSSGSWFIIYLSLNIENILATKAIPVSSLYAAVSRIKLECDLEAYFKEICSLLNINFVTENDVSQLKSGNASLHENTMHINKMQKIEASSLSDEQKTYAAVYNSLIGLGFTPAQVAEIKKRDNGAKCMELISHSFYNLKPELNAKALHKIALLEGGDETIKAFFSTTCETLLRSGYTKYQITQLATRPLGSRYLSTLEIYTNAIIQSAPRCTLEKLYVLALHAESPDVFVKCIKNTYGIPSDSTKNLYLPSSKSLVSSMRGEQNNDVVQPLTDIKETDHGDAQYYNSNVMKNDDRVQMPPPKFN